jgi:hypothetical protein
VFRTKNSQPIGYQDGYEGLALDYLSKMKIAVRRARLLRKRNPSSTMTKVRKRKRVHRVAGRTPKPGHIVAHNRRRRKGEILCHNHVLHTAATANGVHGFHWFTVCAPAGWDPAREEWEVCPCGWRPELGKHYAKAGHVQWWREQIKERGSLEAVYRQVRRRQREYGDRDVG